MAPRLPSLTRRSLFGILMTASCICLLLPARWTSPLKHAGQLLVPAQDLAYSAARRSADAIYSMGDPRQPADAGAGKLEAELASTAAALQQALAENDRLRSLRKDHLPLPTPVLPARVVAWDVAASRDSVLVARGSQRGVRAGDWLTSRLIVDRGGESGVEEGQAVLAEHYLVGRVESAGPYMARVQLLSDLDSPRIEVRIGTMQNNAFRFVDYPCSLRGAGNLRMVIEGVDYRFVDTGREEDRRQARILIHVDDYVFSAPGQLGLPAPLVIGRVARMTEDAKKRLVYNIEVEPLVQVERLSDVFVIPLVASAGK